MVWGNGTLLLGRRLKDNAGGHRLGENTLGHVASLGSPIKVQMSFCLVLGDLKQVEFVVVRLKNLFPVVVRVVLILKQVVLGEKLWCR